MFRGIILGVLTLGGAVLFMIGMDVFLDGVPEPWHTLRWAIFMGLDAIRHRNAPQLCSIQIIPSPAPNLSKEEALGP